MAAMLEFEVWGGLAVAGAGPSRMLFDVAQHLTLQEDPLDKTRTLLGINGWVFLTNLDLAEVDRRIREARHPRGPVEFVRLNNRESSEPKGFKPL